MRHNPQVDEGMHLVPAMMILVFAYLFALKVIYPPLGKTGLTEDCALNCCTLFANKSALQETKTEKTLHDNVTP